jgi:hypothetical protein
MKDEWEQTQPFISHRSSFILPPFILPPFILRLY